MKNFLLLVILIVFVTVIGRNNSNKKYGIVRMDVNRQAVVERKFVLYIPQSIKFGESLVNEKRQGVLILYVNDKKFCYIRPLDVKRNEYFLNEKCGTKLETMEVVAGDKIEFKFGQSNMPHAEKVVLYGEEELR